MARIFKRGDVWWMDYRNQHGRRVWQAASTDKGVAQTMLGQALKAVEQIRGGQTFADPRESKRPLSEHLTEYADDLSRSGRAKRYVYLVGKRIEAAAKHGHWRKVGDATPKSISAYLGKLATDLRTPKTINSTRADLHAFFAWCVRQGRMEANPVVRVEKTEDKREKTRRALSSLECKRLLDAAPRRRKLVYLMLMYTGLRRSEASRLLWGYLHLDGVNPYAELPPTITKSGKPERVPLVAALADALRDARGDAADADRVFGKGIPGMDTFRKDLAAAKIEEVDERGRIVVLHSLRHSLATMLAAAGVPMSVAQRIMRHSDIRLTAETYTDEGLLPLGEAMKALPALVEPKVEPMVVAATGTEDAVGRVPSFVPLGGHNVAQTDISLRLTSIEEIAETLENREVGAISSDGEKCRRQESNLHGF